MSELAVSFTKPKTINDFAREFLDDAGGMTAVAIDRLQHLILEDEDLRTTIATDAIMFFAAQKISAKMRDDRAVIWASVAKKGEVTKSKTGIVHLAKGNRSVMLLDFPLSGGLPLRNATRDEVAEQAQRYSSASLDMGHKARWLSAIAASLAPGQTVGEAFTEEVVTDLHKETANV